MPFWSSGGWFADSIGLIQSVQDVHLHQKKYIHTPQTKVLELVVATLAGLEHLQDISLSAHPLDRDQAVAAAWEQPAWADYSGAIRTLSALNWEEARAVARVLDQVSQPLIQSELDLLRVQRQRLRYDGGLPGLPVSNTSRTYPNVAFGHMDDEIHLGYQAAVVSLQSPTYQRLWLSTAHHPGDTVSCTQAEALVCVAEARTGCRPRRHTDLQQRIEAFVQRMETTQQRLRKQQEALHQAHDRLTEACQQAQERQITLAELEERYQVAPTSRETDRSVGRSPQALGYSPATQSESGACRSRYVTAGREDPHAVERAARGSGASPALSGSFRAGQCDQPSAGRSRVPSGCWLWHV